jgi:hypothetical protein
VLSELSRLHSDCREEARRRKEARARKKQRMREVNTQLFLPSAFPFIRVHLRTCFNPALAPSSSPLTRLTFCADVVSPVGAGRGARPCRGQDHRPPGGAALFVYPATEMPRKLGTSQTPLRKDGACRFSAACLEDTSTDASEEKGALIDIAFSCIWSGGP